MSKIYCEIMCWIIAIVSAIDTYWICKTRTIIAESEENPIGRYIMSIDNGDIALFILIKFIGTFLSVYIIYLLYRFRTTFAIIVSTVIATLQLILLGYLYW